MRWKVVGGMSFVFALGLATFPGSAVARRRHRSPVVTDTTNGVVLRIESIPPGTSVAVETLDAQPGEAGGAGATGESGVLTECFEACETIVDPGDYRLRLRSADLATVGTKTADVTRPTVVHVVDANPSAGTKGLVLGIVGSALLASGFATLAAAGTQALTDCAHPDCSSNTRALAIYGAIALPLGAIMATIGWTLFARNFRLFRIDDLRERDVTHAAPSVRIGIAPAPGGSAGTLTLAF